MSELTKAEFMQLLAGLYSFHRQLEPAQDAQKFVYSIWYEALRDLSFDALRAGLTRFAKENRNLYPGDNWIAIVRQFAQPTLTETEGDCIELAFEAVSMFGRYREAEAMEWIKDRSPLVAASVRRIGFIDLCNCETPEVIRGQLRAVFKTEKVRAREVGGIVESATELQGGHADCSKLIGLVNGINKKLIE